MIFKHLKLDVTLTPSEERTARLIGQGMTYTEVAFVSNRERRAINFHTASIRKKINGSDRADIAIFAIKTGLVSLETK